MLIEDLHLTSSSFRVMEPHHTVVHFTLHSLERGRALTWNLDLMIRVMFTAM